MQQHRSAAPAVGRAIDTRSACRNAPVWIQRVQLAVWLTGLANLEAKHIAVQSAPVLRGSFTHSLAD